MCIWSPSWNGLRTRSVSAGCACLPSSALACVISPSFSELFHFKGVKMSFLLGLGNGSTVHEFKCTLI